MKNKTLIILEKINKYAKTIIIYTKNMKYDEFLKDKKTIEACIFNLSQIGELVKNIDDEIINKYSNIPWREMRNLRNKIVHDYEGIKFDIIWKLIKENLPQLIKDLDKVIKSEK